MEKITGSAEKPGRIIEPGIRATALGWAVAMVVALGTGTGAWAQFVITENGYSATHSTGSGLGEWQKDGSRPGDWQITTSGLEAPNSANGQSFLTLKPANVKCSNDGTYEVKLSLVATQYSNANAIIFRYTNTSNFYAIRIRYNYENNYFPLLFSKNTLYKQGIGTAEKEIGGAFTASGQITLKVVLKGDSIIVHRDGTRIGAVVDSDNKSGQVGYAQADDYNRNLVFHSSSWANAPPSSYTVTWNTNGGAPAPTQITVIADSSITAPAEMTKNGYTFNGWYANSGFTGTAVAFPVPNVTANKEYWAKWTPTPYAITYDLGGGTAGAPANPTTYTVESAVITLTNPTKPGYTFTGWTGSNGTTAQTTVTIPTGSTGNKAYTANWTLISYTITYELGGGTAGTPANPPAYTVESAAITLTNPTKTDYIFAGWTGSNGTVAQAAVTIPAGSTGNKTYTATWTPIFTITFDANGGTVTPASATTGADSTLTASLPTPTRAGFNFDGWFTAATGGTPVATGTKFPANTTIHAHWTEIPSKALMITLDANGGTVSPATSVTGEDSILTATLPTPERTGYDFDGWFTTATGGTMVTTDHKFSTHATIYAHWTPLSYTIACDLGGGIEGTPANPTSYTIESPDITLTEPIRPGYTFDGWTENGSTTPQQTVTISTGSTGNRAYTANWTKIPSSAFTIAFDANGGTVSPQSDTTVTDSTLANLPVPTRAGYNFVGWFTTATGGTEVTTNTKFTASVTIHAHWTQASPNIAEIVTARFVESDLTFSVTYRLTAPKEGHSLNYVITLDEAGSIIKDSARGISIPGNVNNDGDEGTLESISLGSALLFDTLYWIHLYTTDADNLDGAPRAKDSVRTGSFKWQTVKVTPGSSQAVAADNGKFKLSAKGWRDVISNFDVTVTKATAPDMPSDAELQAAGFIPVPTNGYGYKYTVTDPAIMSSYGQLLGAFKVSIKADMPESYAGREKDVRLYRWSETNRYWEVAFDTEYDAVNRCFTGTAVDSVWEDAGKIYRLMVNTKRLLVTYPNDRLQWDKNDEINPPKYIVESPAGNVGNYSVKLFTGPANGTRMKEIAGTDTLLENNTYKTRLGYSDKALKREISFTITSEVTGAPAVFNGVLAFLVVDNGSGSEIHNISYQIRSEEATDHYGGFPVTPEDNVWLPFASQVVLDTPSVKTALAKFFGGQASAVTKCDTLYRLFRWQKKWVEYDGKNDSIFTMEPGRLMWLKTSPEAAKIALDFGLVTSMPLRRPYDKITLPKGEWTDFVLPFGFTVRLGDIIDSTGAGVNNLEFYKWTKTKGNYKTNLLVRATVVTDSSLEFNGEKDVFTIYNNGDRDITLRIPATPAFLSRHKKTVGTQSKRLSKISASQQAADDPWYYTLNAYAGDAELSSVMMGYSAINKSLAVPPSFNNATVVLVNDDGTEMGHHFGPSIASGRTYKLRFYNDGKYRTQFKFSASPSANTPISSRVTFVKASNGEILNSGNGTEYGIAVAGASHEDVFMVIGSNGYRGKAASTNAGAKFTVDKIRVNRTARSARFSYYIPASGIETVEVSIYDIKGRQIWKHAHRVKAADWNTTEWNSRSSRKGAAIGLYIARVKAIGPGGMAVGADTKRIMFAK
jgi:uncharacterized repeat protein (TIGR02543 family)